MMLQWHAHAQTSTYPEPSAAHEAIPPFGTFQPAICPQKRTVSPFIEVSGSSGTKPPRIGWAPCNLLLVVLDWDDRIALVRRGGEKLAPMTSDDKAISTRITLILATTTGSFLVGEEEWQQVDANRESLIFLETRGSFEDFSSSKRCDTLSMR